MTQDPHVGAHALPRGGLASDPCRFIVSVPMAAPAAITKGEESGPLAIGERGRDE